MKEKEDASREARTVAGDLVEEGALQVRAGELQTVKKENKSNLECITDLENWDQLAVRPIASYFKHFWKNTLGLVSRFCTTAIKVLSWGFHADAPRRIAHDLLEYNEKLGKGEASMLQAALWDIKEFFPNVDQQLFRFCIEQAAKEVQDKWPKVRYF